MKPGLLLLLIFSFSYLRAGAQDIFPAPTHDQKMHIKAERALGKIEVDGLLSEPDWNNCKPIKGFVQSSPFQGKPATYDTEVKVLYDDKNIYIGAICHNPAGSIPVQDLRRDFSYSNNELFGVFIDPFQDVQSPVQTFLVTPLSTQADALIYDDRIYDFFYDAVWQAKSTLSDTCWLTEIAIPWSTLRYPPGSTSWSINFNRNIRALNEVTGWSPWPKAYTVGRLSYGGIVDNLEPPANKTNIEIAPYLLNSSTKENGGKLVNKREAGGELKWLINTNTSLEASVNTDFAQADADRQVINLKRSSFFFPEQRQFFLENANLFAIGQDGIIQPFFSRRIGLSSGGTPLSIDEGIRFIHQDGKAATGALLIHQSDPENTNDTWFGVLREQINLNTKSRIGTLITYRFDELHGVSNTVASFDGFWHLSQPFYIRPMVSFMLPANAGKGGQAFFTEIGYFKNKVSFQLFETYSSQNYQPGTGFIKRTNFINTQPNLLFTIPVNWMHGHVRYFEPGINADIYHNAATGEWQEANLNLIPFQLVTKTGTSLTLTVQPSLDNLKSAFTPVPRITVSPGIFRFTRVDLNLTTDQSAPYSILADVSTGGYFNGSLNSYIFTLRAVPIPKIAAGLTYTYNLFKGFGPAGSKVNNYLLAPELRLSFTPKIQLSGFYQYNTVAGNGGLNMRFAWEYKPLSFIYLVFNDLRSISSPVIQNAFSQQTGIIKISYVHQL